MGKTELSIAYPDREWGVPVHSDRTPFEFLILEGVQVRLSCETVLKKRGFKGSGTICYAFMQVVGMVNDYTMTCFRYQEILRSPDY